MLCLASSFAPPSSDGHGQHWPLDEAFILRRRQERGSAPQGCWGRDIGHQPRCRGHNGARGAGIHNTPRGIHVCGSALWKKRDSRRNEDVSVRRNELELECCRPRPRDELDPHPGTVCHRIRIRFARIRIFLSSLKIVASSLRTDLIVRKQGQDDPSRQVCV